MTNREEEITAAVGAARKAIDAEDKNAADLLADALQLLRPDDERAESLIKALDHLNRVKASKGEGEA